MQPVGGVGAVQFKPMEVEDVAAANRPVGAAVTAPQEAASVVPLPCAEAADEPAPSTASTR